MKTNKILLALFFSTGLFGVFSSAETDSKLDAANNNGVYVLNQGSYQRNNASISFYDFTTSITTSDIFTTMNSRGLGDTSQDLIKYGSKIYVAVYKSSLIEVLNASTGISIKTIPMFNTSNQPSSPMSLASFSGKVYITLYDGHVAQLDTMSLLIEKTISVGRNPQGIVVSNNKLYVANSGGMTVEKDSSISVIDPVSFTVTKNIKVIINPTIIKADSYGDVYVISNGDYNLIPYTLQRIDTSGNVTRIPSIHPVNMTIDGDMAYLYSYNYDANWLVVNKAYITYDVKGEKQINSNVIASTAIANIPCSIDVDPIKKDIYIGSTDYVNTGKMYCFGQDGVLKFNFNTGVNPSKALIVRSEFVIETSELKIEKNVLIRKTNSSNSIQIDCDEQIEKIELFNVSGVRLLTKSISNTSAIIELDKFLHQILIVKVILKNRILTEKYLL